MRKKRLAALHKNYPDIIPVEGEDLNLYSMQLRILKKCWMNRMRFKTISVIADVTGVSEREILRIAKEENFPLRRTIKS